MDKKIGLFALLIFLSGVALIAQTSPSVRYAYDEAGNLVGALDTSGNAQTYTFDAEGNLVATERLLARGPVDLFFLEPSRGQRPAPPNVVQGTVVSLYGMGFSATAAQNQVTFNGVAAVVESSTEMMIRTRVPAGATSGPVVVTSPQGTSTSRSNFIVTNVCSTAPAGGVSWWAGEGNAADVLGANPGTLRGGVTFGRGRVGQAFIFDGATGNVRIPASASLNVGTGNGFTIEAWISPADFQPRPVVEWNNEAGGVGVHFRIGKPDPSCVPNCLPGALYANIKDTSGNDHIISTAAGTLRPNTFQHVALTYNKLTGTARLLLNGRVMNEQNLGIFTPQTTFPLFLGLRPSGPSSPAFYAGKLDEVTLFNRALRIREIEAIYGAGEGGKCRP